MIKCRSKVLLILSLLFCLLSCSVEDIFLSDKIPLVPRSHTFLLEVLDGFVVIIRFRWKMKLISHFQRDINLGKSHIHGSQLGLICTCIINSILSSFLIFPIFWIILVFTLSPFFNVIFH